MIEAKNLSVSYGRHIALEDVSIKLGRGDLNVVLGANGAGKTTLVNAIAGTVPLLSGTIMLDGRNITHEPTHNRVKFRLATVPQGRGLFPDMSVEDNLALGSFVSNDKDEIESRRREIFRVFPRLSERAKQAASSRCSPSAAR